MAVEVLLQLHAVGPKCSLLCDSCCRFLYCADLVLVEDQVADGTLLEVLSPVIPR